MKALSLSLLALSLASASAHANPFDVQLVLSAKGGKAKDTITQKDAEKERATFADLKKALQNVGKRDQLPCYQGSPKDAFDIVRALVENAGGKVKAEEEQPVLDLVRTSRKEYVVVETTLQSPKGKQHVVSLVECSDDLDSKSEYTSSYSHKSPEDGSDDDLWDDGAES
jgi:hypothetical protein